MKGQVVEAASVRQLEEAVSCNECFQTTVWRHSDPMTKSYFHMDCRPLINRLLQQGVEKLSMRLPKQAAMAAANGGYDLGRLRDWSF